MFDKLLSPETIEETDVYKRQPLLSPVSEKQNNGC